MATTRVLFRSKTLIKHHHLLHPLRFLSTSTSSHQFTPPSDFLSSWNPPKDPKEAEAKLAKLRRDYAKKVKVLRKEYIQEMELQMAEKRRKEDAKREAMRIANEERRTAKAAAQKVRAAEREVAEKEFRQMLLKERAEKLEYWRMKEKHIKGKKKDKDELLRRKSSMWVDEANLEKRILDIIVDTTPL